MITMNNLMKRKSGNAKFCLLLLSFVVALPTVSSARSPLTTNDYQGAPPIINQVVLKPGDAKRAAAKGLGEFNAQIPSYDGKGNLIASWTPSENVSVNWTFVIVHGGNGIGGIDYNQAKTLRENFNANVLILDSFWSRGTTYNGGEVNRLKLGQRIDANDRAFDLNAAGKWLSAKGVDPKKTVVFGGSQGGWTALRAMTNEPLLLELTKPYYSFGIAIYPACEPGRYKRWLALGPYHGPMLVLTGGRDIGNPSSDCDSVTLNSATKWVEFPEATHGWNRPTGAFDEPSVDGDCSKAHYAKGQNNSMCYSERRTRETYELIAEIIGYQK